MVKSVIIIHILPEYVVKQIYNNDFRETPKRYYMCMYDSLNFHTNIAISYGVKLTKLIAVGYKQVLASA